MPNTMAEAFCEEYLMTWTEHGQDFTGWRHRDIFTRSNRMSRAGAISLFHPLEEDHLLIVTVFQDRSWIVQEEPTGGAPPMVGTREDERRIPDLIHRTLEARAGGRPGLRGRIQSLRHNVRSQLLQKNVQTAPAGTLSFLSVQHAFSPPPQGLLIPARRPKMASGRK